MAEAVGGVEYQKIREEIKRDREFEEEQIMELEIRDTAPHPSAVADCSRFSVVTIVVENGLDQAVSVQPNGSRLSTVVGYAAMGAAVDVPAAGMNYIMLTPTIRGWMPFVFVIVTAAAPPTSGVLNVYALKRR